jgi:hypothetical protein
MQELLGPLFELNLPHILRVLEGEVQIFERDIPLPDGSVRHSLASYYPHFVAGTVVGFTAQVADVTRMKELERELLAAKLQAEIFANHDYLTGLPNRVQLEDTIAFAISQVRRLGALLESQRSMWTASSKSTTSMGTRWGMSFCRRLQRG